MVTDAHDPCGRSVGAREDAVGLGLSDGGDRVSVDAALILTRRPEWVVRLVS